MKNTKTKIIALLVAASLSFWIYYGISEGKEVGNTLIAAVVITAISVFSFSRIYLALTQRWYMHSERVESENRLHIQRQADAEAAYKQRRADAHADYVQRQKDAEVAYAQRRADAQADYVQHQKDAETAYAQRRADSHTDYVQRRKDACSDAEARERKARIEQLVRLNKDGESMSQTLARRLAKEAEAEAAIKEFLNAGHSVEELDEVLNKLR